MIVELTFSVALSFFSASYLAYSLYVRKCAKKSWNLNLDYSFEPSISILIPVHNEENNIISKLENIKKIDYPKEKIEIIVANDASNDNTIKYVKSFAKRNHRLKIKIVDQYPRAGKSRTLNKALMACTNPIIIVSDADTLWPPDILRKALIYLSDPKVGAITGWGININSDKSWVVKSENTYLDVIKLLRLGESKIFSTIRFEGGFCAYKKNVIEKFDYETGSDDSGTALEIVQKGYRTILVPEALFYTSFPTKFFGKLKIKIRRGCQLVGLWFKCFKLLLKRRLILPKKIVVPEIIMFIVDPLIFLLLIAIGTIVIFNSLFPLGLILLLTPVIFMILAKQLFLELIINQFLLLCALIAFLFKKRFSSWERSK